MATATVTDYITRTINATATASSTNRATPQGGVFEGENPSKQVLLFYPQPLLVQLEEDSCQLCKHFLS